MKDALPEENILSIDIGGSHVKAMLLTSSGALPETYHKLPTPMPASPQSVVQTLADLVRNMGPYSKIAVGFPGNVRQGRIYTAPNLGTALWRGFDLQNQLSQVLGKPVRVVNDADLQGLGVVKGQGVEMVITLGTGFGTALLEDGRLLPHLELAHHPISGDMTYDQYVGEKALREIGEEAWSKRMEQVLAVLKTVFAYDHLYISGGNAGKLRFALEANISLASNREGITGGLRLWQQPQLPPGPGQVPDTLADVLFSTG
ncbi:MAG: ROK family protein [Adhaeribacter sp.]